MMKNIAKFLAAILCLTLLCGACASCDKQEKTDDPATGSSQPAEDEKGIWLPFVENK